ncbi:CubicO group peptidase (beta-lactamase class C family) [Natronocella acetinitrilica]|uniref:CubicO group peptidase (Beta-lactamase class C family) n=1 Tax=Natronocella acetinitrilica TaxID=414046 RepID=A0AAE3G0K4_9GAMM|nr:serine hydrolase [Natronocella acetinitrilica]MCP1673321.1 CubicO group peptidase (beta-lactamase class C family) [Natronocella acetinitrilica]
MTSISPQLRLCCLSGLFALVVWGQSAAALDESLAAEAVTRAGELERTHSLLVAVDGEIVLEESYRGPGTAQPANVKSLSKTVLAALVGAAIEQGLVAGDEQPIAELIGTRMPENTEPGVSDITVGHLLAMQSGLERTSGANYGRWVASDDWVTAALTRPFVDAPGGRMLYSTGNSHILSAALTWASGRTTRELAQDWLGNPLNIVIPEWPRDPQGIYFGGNDMNLSPRALLQIGELYRHDGVLNGERVLPEGWVENSWTPRGRSPFNNNQYGYGWFITELDGEPAYYGWGFGGQMLYVIPSVAMTIVITSDPTPPGSGSAYLRHLDALVAETLIPAARRARQ